MKDMIQTGLRLLSEGNRILDELIHLLIKGKVIFLGGHCNLMYSM